jgi:serine protease
MKIAHFAALLLAPLLALQLTPPAAAATPQTRQAALPPVEGEVIVGFKPDSATTRKHALAARSTTADSAQAAQAAAAQMLAARASALGGRMAMRLEAGNAIGPDMQVMRASAGNGMSAEQLAQRLAADPDVAFAVPNGRRRALTAPNDPLYAAAAAGVRPRGPDSGQWYLRAPTATVPSAINIEAAWARTRGSAGVVVAVLDTGVRFDHPELGRVANGGRLLPGYDFVSDTATANDGGGRDADPSDPGDYTTAAENSAVNGKFYKCDPRGIGEAVGSGSSWHGTATAALIGAKTDNNTGMAGTAPGVSVLPVRVLGKCGGVDSDIQAAMLWAAGISQPGVPDNPNPARVINMSLGSDGVCNASYKSVVARINAVGTVVVAAAGNSAGGPVGVPASCPGVVAVLALRHAGSKVGFSDLGPEIAISAPGGNCVNIGAGQPCLYPILTATDTGSQGPVGPAYTDSFDITVGTSFSSPLVAGVVGLMLSQPTYQNLLARDPAAVPGAVRTALQATARPFPTSGADNGPDDATPVRQCNAPTSGVEQLQCYCNTAQCGAGMLDAGAAVATASGPLARVVVGTPSPTAAAGVALDGSGSLAGGTASLASYAWSLVDGGGIVTGFATATNASSASVTPSAAGTFTVQLTVTDSSGASASSRSTVTVAAAPVTPPASTGGGGGGGGAFSWAWVLGVGLAAALLHKTRRRPGVAG